MVQQDLQQPRAVHDLLGEAPREREPGHLLPGPDLGQLLVGARIEQRPLGHLPEPQEAQPVGPAVVEQEERWGDREVLARGVGRELPERGVDLRARLERVEPLELAEDERRVAEEVEAVVEPLAGAVLPAHRPPGCSSAADTPAPACRPRTAFRGRPPPSRSASRSRGRPGWGDGSARTAGTTRSLTGEAATLQARSAPPSHRPRADSLTPAGPQAAGRRYRTSPSRRTASRSSRSSVTVASIFCRAKSSTSSPSSIFQFPPDRRTGNEETIPSSTP